MQEGLYKVQFQTPLGLGAGVVVVAGGKLRGGDSMMAYDGSFTEAGDQLTAQVSVFVHTNSPDLRSVLGVKKATLTLKGSSTGNTAQMTGTAPEAPGVKLAVSLAKLN